MTSAALPRSVRERRAVIANPATSKTSAAGSSHEIWPPIAELNIRERPVSPQPLPPPTEPVSSPPRRPRPL